MESVSCVRPREDGGRRDETNPRRPHGPARLAPYLQPRRVGSPSSKQARSRPKRTLYELPVNPRRLLTLLHRPPAALPLALPELATTRRPLRGRAVRAVLGRGEACGRGHATRLSPMCQASERGRVRGGEGRRGRERRGETRSAREVGRARGLSPARTSSERVTRPAAGLQERARASSVASATQRRAHGARRRATRPTCEGPPGPCLDRALVLARRQQASEDILALSFAVQDSYGTRDGGGGNGRRAQNSTARRASGCQSASASHSRRPQRSTTRQGRRRNRERTHWHPR